MQRRDYSREEKFLADEKHTLRPLPKTAWELKCSTELRVAANNCIYLGRDSHYYSVPYTYIGQKVLVVYTRTIVRIYCKNECIATHQRVVGFGYTTVKEHLCSAHQHYNSRSPEYYIETAGKKSVSLAKIFTLIFNSPKSPEIFYKTCDGLLSLCRKTDPARFEKACQIALGEGVYSYRFIKALIEGKSLLMVTEPCRSMEPDLFAPLPFPKENIRGRDYYQ